MLSKARVVLQGHSAYAHEQEAIAFLRNVLPDTDPYHVWELVEFLDPSSGRLLEIDAIVLGYSALYLIEIKSGPGVYEGDTVDWYRTAPGEPSRFMEPPLKLTNFKAKVLKSLIQAKLRDSARCPWVQPLVFLSHENTELKFRHYGDQCVVTRKNLLEAVKSHRFPGADPGERRRVDAPQMKAVAQALDALGVRASKGVARVGSYELGGIIEEGSGYQDRRAQHADTPSFKRRARIYLVPQQTSVERRQQLRRAADREARLLEDVKEHPNVLRMLEYVTDAPLGPTVLFDAFDGVPLDAFLRSHPNLSFSQRIQLIEKVGRALAHCHRKSVVHGALAPGAVLVREADKGELDLKLYNFQLGSGENVTPTLHWTAMGDERWALYQAPELRENPQERSVVTDVFSLGALAYFVLTGQPPADSLLELDARLARDHELDPRATADGIPDKVAQLVALATTSKPVNRADEVHEWLEWLLEAATAPDPVDEAPEVNPLTAAKEDYLGKDLRVLGVLGHGASSRVLEVEKDGRPYALKVALTADDDDRLKEEARALDSIRHARIVQFVELRTYADRTCILMAKAGERTLQRLLAVEGVVSLDFASRFGEDLLLALEELEERQLLHRDIKPANLGVGALGKKANHLTLFDFSLALDLRAEATARAGRTQLSVGTAVYRDPFLRLRGAWDAAADRWSAAVTLHEMLTGVRPSFSVDGAVALEPEAELVLAAERFDASAREHLVPFFTKALARHVAARFDSAGSMRQAWNRCFDAPGVIHEAADVSAPPTPEPRAVLSEAAIAAIAPETPIEALPLSVRAKNALDRAGMSTARDLLELPDNRLSAVRGVGSGVAKEILALRDRWKSARSVTETPGKPFFAGYRGEDILVTTAGLDTTTGVALRDAGLKTLAAVAQAPERNVIAITTRIGRDVEALRKVLEEENNRSNARQRPTTLEGWIDALLPEKKARSAQNLRVLFGLAEPFLARIDVPVAEVAKALDMTRANLYLQLGRERDQWLQHGALPELRRLAHALVSEAGGALPVRRAAEALRERIPSDGSSGKELALAQAAALLRIMAQVEREDEGGIAWERLDKVPWLFASSGLVVTVQRLGQLADQLAERPVLASPGEATRLLTAVVEGTSLAPLSPERLTELAALASTNAARSSRLELYPRQLDPARALSLSGSVLTGDLTPSLIQQRVNARYPEAAPLPPRPALDVLLAPLQIKWDEASERYVRPGERRTTEHTDLSTSISLPTLPSSQRALDPGYLALEDFEERLRITRDRKNIKVIGVRAHKAHEIALALTKALGLRRVSLDDEFKVAIHEIVKEQGVDLDTLYAADQVGPGGDDWPELRNVAQQAAERVAQRLLPAPEPLLLVQPGLLARYRLDGFLRRLLDASRDPKCAALFLLVPSPDRAGVPKINDKLVIPEVGLPQTLWVPVEWPKDAPSAA
jgi:serine/threonine protein kinase